MINIGCWRADCEVLIHAIYAKIMLKDTGHHSANSIDMQYM